MNRSWLLTIFLAFPCPSVAAQEKPTTATLKVFSPHDHSKSVELQALAEFTFKDRRPVSLKPAAGGSILIGQHPFSNRLSIYRLDQPELLGQLPARGDGQHFTANNHSVYLFDEATNRVTRYPFSSLRPEKSFLFDTKQGRGVRISTGCASSNSPIFVWGYDGYALVHPENMTRIDATVETFPPPRQPLPPHLLESVISPDGKVVASSSQVGWWRDNILHLYAARNQEYHSGWWLSYNGSQRSAKGHLIALGNTRELHPRNRNIQLVPGLSSPLSYGKLSVNAAKSEVDLQVFTNQGQAAILDVDLNPGNQVFISFKYSRLAIVSDKPERLAVFEFDTAKIAESLGVPAWLEIRGPGLAKQEQPLTLDLVPSYGELKDFQLIQEPPDATIKGNKIHWKTPAVTRLADFQFIVEFTDAKGREGRAFADVIVTPK